MRDMAQRPQPFVRKSVVVAVLALPSAARRAAACIRGLSGGTRIRSSLSTVSRSASARAHGDPRAVAGAQHRLQRRHQAARGNLNASIPFARANVRVRLAIGNHEQRPLNRVAAIANPQALRRPNRLARLAQARLFLGRRASLRQTARKFHTSCRERRQKIFIGKLRRGADFSLPPAQLLHPLGRP